MHLETTRFGSLEVDDSAVLTFTQPIIGFQEFRRFVLLDVTGADHVKWLQSIDAGDLAFIVMDPRTVVPDYSIRLRADELTELAVASVEDLDIYTLVVVPQDAKQARTNLKAPIVINPKQRLAKQTILDRSSYPVQFPLAQAEQGAEPSQEVSNARFDA